MRRRLSTGDSGLQVDNAAAVAALQRLIDARAQSSAPRSERVASANRWLNPELLAPAAGQDAPPRQGGRSAPQHDPLAYRLHPPASARWQAIAAALLLLASGAFSYLAWSRVTEASAPLPIEAAASASAVHAAPAAGAGAMVQRVRELREENLRLRHRLAALQDTPATR